MKKIHRNSNNFLTVFRDDGIIFNISLIQFFIELSQSISIFIFFYFFPQKSIGLTRLVALLNISISTVIIPAFYFVGDCNFRRQIQVHGIRRAIMVAFLEKQPINQDCTCMNLIPPLLPTTQNPNSKIIISNDLFHEKNCFVTSRFRKNKIVV